MLVQTAKKDIENGSKVFKRFWDDVARIIVDLGVRVLTGDFNMALWFTVVELRARGLMANLAAWYPWKNHLESGIRMDSCCIVVIGPARGVRMMHNPSVLNDGIQSIEFPPKWGNTQKIVRDENNNEVDREPWPVPVFEYLGQGFQLDNYQPKVPERKEQMVCWSCTPVLQPTDPVVVEIKRHAQTDKGMWPWGCGDHNMGFQTWEWPELPTVKQKPTDVKLFDPMERFFKERGSHMPQMIFLGDASNCRRTPDSYQRRLENAARRGWNLQKIMRHKGKGSSGHHSKNRSSGKGENGANHKGEGKGKGKDANKGKGKDKSGGGWEYTRGRGGLKGGKHWSSGQQSMHGR